MCALFTVCDKPININKSQIFSITDINWKGLRKWSTTLVYQLIGMQNKGAT